MGWGDLGFTAGTDEDFCTDVGLDSGEGIGLGNASEGDCEVADCDSGTACVTVGWAMVLGLPALWVALHLPAPSPCSGSPRG